MGTSHEEEGVQWEEETQEVNRIEGIHEKGTLYGTQNVIMKPIVSYN